ncbi:MAG TPA: type II secretion system protein [Nocardioidaceae bacterium]|nr:type II secretion system protein [Nocardioidaceae bacterium]
MSRSADPAVRRRADAAGFTLVEVMVALGIVTLVLLALVPQLVVGIRSTGLAREMTHTKGIAQGQIERMHNLPFHVAREAGQFVDVLDRYYPNASTSPSGPTCTGAGGIAVPPSTSATGFVTATGARCSYEPAAGSAFYRVVEQRTDAATGSHTIVVNTQFLSDGTPPAAVAPDASYNSQTTGKDNPPSNQIGVTVTVFSQRFPARKPVTLYTQIASQPPAFTRLRGRSGVRVLEIGSATWDGTTATPLSLSAGVVNIAGSVSTASKITVSRGAVTVTRGTGTTAYGLSWVDAAPPAATVASRTAGEGSVVTEGCALACWGSSELGSVLVTSDDGLPTVGSATAPARAVLSGATNNGLSFGNAPNAADYEESLKFAGNPVNLVRLNTSAGRSTPGVTACITPGSTYVEGAGFVLSTASEVQSCATAAATVVELFPTTTAPTGLVRLELVAASASCTVTGSTHVPTTAFDYQLIVDYWDNLKGGAGGYQRVGPIMATTASDLLAAVNLTTPVGGGKQLGDYIASWSSVTPDRVKATASANIAEVNIPGVVTISTQPTLPDPDLTDDRTPPGVSLTMGALSCYAEDRR